MDKITFLIVIGTFASWGIGSFFSKLATTKVGEQAVFYDIIVYAPVIIIYSLIVFKFKNLIQADKAGIGFGILAGLIGSFGLIGFYYLLTRAEVSTILPLTALYPALTTLLAVVFLKESLTPTKILGIILSLTAIYLLSK